MSVPHHLPFEVFSDDDDRHRALGLAPGWYFWLLETPYGPACSDPRGPYQSAAHALEAAVDATTPLFAVHR